ncbi:hypothetical protein [uncultured Clostridium sp.]|uniref:hypothetical protein n=1 Tax=uncultured Clostridium sp. TaxID=59620 RepID=UPI00260C7193|nr:hypothetical protein [uncultured Clostridium sp.]
MIGQENIKEKLISLYNQNKLPKVIIINGARGYGKKELIKWFSETTNIPYKLFENKIEDIKKALDCAMNEFTISFYVFNSIEQMNATQNKTSQNALLKFLEEPPQNAYIFLLCRDKSLLLPTILSRAITIDLESYSREQLKNFGDNELALNIFNCPGDLIKSKNLDVEKLVQDTNKIIDLLDKASVSNALNLSKYIKIKEEDDGYDLDLFIKALKFSFVQKYKENKNERLKQMFDTFYKSLNHLKINNKYFMDNFVINNYREIKGWK